MKTTGIIIIVFLATIGISKVALSSETSAKDFGLKNRLSQEGDTSDVNVYIRKALEYKPKSKDLQYIKANIDTAELICVEKNIEFPPQLHLARAEYFFLTSDFTSASQEATIAMKKSKSSGETAVLAKTMNSWTLQPAYRVLYGKYLIFRK
jgi:hypothetical protein